MKICVLGLGYIGLPTAVMFAKSGLKVHGVDVNPSVIEMLSNRQLHIEEPGLKEMMIEVMEKGNFTVSTEPDYADAYIIAVPTPINDNKEPNLDYVRSATSMIVPYLQVGNLVVLESTSPPKTVEHVIVPILAESGLKIGEEIYVSHSPERVLPGRLFIELVENDRIVGGINEESSKRTVELYRYFVKGNIHVTDATTAEMVKLMENTYRDVNIALANEFAKISDKLGFNIWDAIQLANYHPRVNLHFPGPGVGGHCIAVDPWFIIEKAPETAQLISLARNINDSMPAYVTEFTKELLSPIKKPVVSVLGLAFKGNIDDMRESPAIDVIENIKSFAKVNVYDPHVVSQFEGKVDALEECVDGADLVLILTDHNEFKSLDINMISERMRTKQVFDTKNILSRDEWEEQGFSFHLLGDGKHKQIRSESLNSVAVL